MKDTSVLIVEDEAVVAFDIARTLKELGYGISGICSSSEEASHALESQKVDIILMDIQIKGGMDGIELATRVSREYRIPVIFLTAFSDDQTLERAKLAEPYGYLSKSSYFREIRTTIEMALYRHKMKLMVKEKEELLSFTLKNIDEAVITSTSGGQILFYNQRAGQLFSLPPVQSDSSAESPNLDHVTLSRMDGTPIADFLKETGIPEKLILKIKGKRKSIPLECFLSDNLITKKGEHQKVFVFRDISSRQKIQEMEALLSNIVESSEDIIAGVSLNGSIKSWNRGAESIMGIPAALAVGRSLDEVFPGAPLPKFTGREEDSSLDYKDQTLEFFYHSPSDEQTPLSVKFSSLFNDEGIPTGYSLIGRDMTVRTNMEKQIIEAEERERTRIGQDLHDGLGQHLTGISLKNKALQSCVARANYKDAEKISLELGDLIRQAITETRELSRGLIPEILKNDGLSDALRNLAGYIERVYGIPTLCRLEECPDLKKPVETQLYHIAQEGINNAVKHSGADSLQVLFYLLPGECILEIRDNGKGFDKKNIKKGLGLDNMRYRADIIKGNLEIQSSVKNGTAIICRLNR